jgi:hypothetical protein
MAIVKRKKDVIFEDGYLLSGEDVLNEAYLVKQVNKYAKLVESVVDYNRKLEQAKAIAPDRTEVESIWDKYAPKTESLDKYNDIQGDIDNELNVLMSYNAGREEFGTLVDFLEEDVILLDETTIFTSEKFDINPLELKAEDVVKLIADTASSKVDTQEIVSGLLRVFGSSSDVTVIEV